MKTQIDIKSAVFGLVLGVTAMFALGAGFSNNSVGKYQVSVGTEYMAIVDTQTGEAWVTMSAGTGLGRGAEKSKAFLDAK